MAKNPLVDLFNLIERGHIEKDIELEYQGCKKVFRLRSLLDEDYTWRDRFVAIDNPLTMATSLRVPTLAIATVSIDGVPVADIDGMTDEDDIPPSVKTHSNDRKFVVAYNMLRQYEKMPRDLINILYQKFVNEIESISHKIDGESVKNS